MAEPWLQDKIPPLPLDFSETELVKAIRRSSDKQLLLFSKEPFYWNSNVTCLPLWIEIRLHQFVYLIVPYSFSVLELGKSVCLSPKMLEPHCNHTKLFQRGKKMTSKKQWPLSGQFQWLSMLPKDLFISTKKEFIMNQVRIHTHS